MIIDEIVAKLDPPFVAQRIGRPFDEALNSYRLASNVVGTFAEFKDMIGDFYNHVFSRCVAQGGSLASHEAYLRAEEILEREYRRRRGDIVSAFNDAHDATEGGLRAVLTVILEAQKHEAIERYVRSVFDQYVARNSWANKVSLIRSLFERSGPHLASSLRRDEPERYADDYLELVREYVDGISHTARAMRRH